MLISYNWIHEYFGGALPDPEGVVEKLVAHSFEIEGLEKAGDDYVIDIDVLPNRGPDSLSHNGIAKELGVILDTAPSIPEAKISYEDNVDTVSVELEEKKLVRRVNKMIVAGLTVGESPKWLRERLEALGQKSINNVVDITNYVMFETGQPIHAFDYDKLDGSGTMVLRRAKKDEKIKLLDDNEYVLDTKTMVWADKSKALDVAGIKGGSSSSVDTTTRRVLLSACSFDPVHIRKTRQRLKLVTDASKRFEQGLTSKMTKIGIERTAKMLAELAGGKVGELYDKYPKTPKARSASAFLSDVNKVLGTQLTHEDLESLLKRFEHAGFSYERDGERYTLVAPTERKDVNTKHDFIEEVGRIYGYNKITSSIPSKDDFVPKVFKNYYYISLLKQTLVKEGFSEVYNYVMRDSGDIELANSLVEGKEFLRTDMKSSITENLVLNIKNADILGLDRIMLFEINKVFNKDEEYWALGIGIKNTKGCSGEKESEIANRICGKVEKVLGMKGKWDISEVSVPTQDSPKGIGVFAEVNVEEIIEKLSTPDSYGKLIKKSETVSRYKSISQYPSVLRDIAVWMPSGSKAQELLTIIEKQTGGLLVKSSLFDEFEKDRRVSYAYRLVFQSQDRTLTDDEVNKIMTDIESAVAKKGWEVR